MKEEQQIGQEGGSPKQEVPRVAEVVPKDEEECKREEEEDVTTQVGDQKEDGTTNHEAEEKERTFSLILEAQRTKDMLELEALLQKPKRKAYEEANLFLQKYTLKGGYKEDKPKTPTKKTLLVTTTTAAVSSKPKSTPSLVPKAPLKKCSSLQVPSLITAVSNQSAPQQPPPVLRRESGSGGALATST